MKNKTKKKIGKIVNIVILIIDVFCILILIKIIMLIINSDYSFMHRFTVVILLTMLMFQGLQNRVVGRDLEEIKDKIDKLSKRRNKK